MTKKIEFCQFNVMIMDAFANEICLLENDKYYNFTVKFNLFQFLCEFLVTCQIILIRVEFKLNPFKIVQTLKK